MYAKFEQLPGIILCLMLFPGTVRSQSDIGDFFKSASQYKDIVVAEVLSADTIVLKGGIGEKGEVIKLIGLRVPDNRKKRKTDIKRDDRGFTIKEPVNPITTLEEKAFEFVKELLEGQHVRIEFDNEKNDEAFRTLAYVFLVEDGTFINAKILRNGYAHLSIRPPNMKYAKELRQAYQDARNEQRGYQGE